ncbi:hypothetical protein O6H91_21G072400 [Diphasiastrum complanatum]|nr:hypothetical protein O6H91_21G072400 [Diphasiastrum complanatum]
MAALKDRRLACTVLSVIMLSCTLQVPIFYVLARVSTLSCFNAASIFRSFSLNDSVNASDRIRRITANDQPTESSPADSSNIREDQLNTLGFSTLNKVDTNLQQSLHRHGYAHYSFVQFNSYRESARAFYVVGITSAVNKHFDHPVHNCEWLSSQNSTNIHVTKANMIYVYYDQFPRLYVVATVNCTFDEDVGMDDLGGSLIITVSVGPYPGDTEKAVAMVEQQGAASEFVRKRDNPPPYKIAFCGPPMHGNIRAEWIVHWLVYHHYLWKGKEHFFFYNVGGLQDHHHRLLDPWVKSGYLTIIDASDQGQYPSWYHNQLMLANDCLHRTRFLASWTFFHDLDEFLHIPPPRSLSSLLSRYRDKPYITFGSIGVNLTICADPQSADLAADWPVQRLLWMHKRPYCADATFDPWVCRQWQGARKYAANSRKVYAAAVHTAARPDVGGADLNATIATMYHYHGVLSTQANICQVNVSLSLPSSQLKEIVPEIADYNKEYAISKTTTKARKSMDLTQLLLGT